MKKTEGWQFCVDNVTAKNPRLTVWCEPKVLVVGCGLMVAFFIFNGKLEVLEKAVTNLQLNSLDISSRHFSFADDQLVKAKSGRDDDLIIVYNRVPKTGSTSFAGIAYELCKDNRFHVAHVNITRNQWTLGLFDQMRFITNITGWVEKKPAI